MVYYRVRDPARLAAPEAMRTWQVGAGKTEARSLAVRCLLGIQAVCLVGAGLNHAHDIWQGGWLPYAYAPWPINCFWTALAVVDLLAAAALLWRPKVGLVLVLLIMVADVGVNSYAKYGLGFDGWYGDLSLQLQTLFLGFVVGALPLAWRSTGPH